MFGACILLAFIDTILDLSAHFGVPWDHVLDPAETIWILVADLSVYQALRQQSSDQFGDVVDLRPPRRGAPHYDSVHIHFKFVPYTDVLFRVSTLAEQMCNTQLELAETQDRLSRVERNLGICIETLAADRPEVAELFSSWRVAPSAQRNE